MAKKILNLNENHPEGFNRITLFNEGHEPMISIQNLNILFEILEMVNFETNTNYYIDIKYMNRSLENENNMKFHVCACKSIDRPTTDKNTMKWNLKIIDNLNDIFDLTSNPIVLCLSKMTIDDNTGIESSQQDYLPQSTTSPPPPSSTAPIESDQFENKLIIDGYMLIDLFDLVKFDSEPIIDISYVQSIGEEKLSDMKTWKNQPHIKYKITPEKPLLENIEPNMINSIKITTEFVFNMPMNLMHQDNDKNYYYCCDMILPEDIDRNQKIISSKNGKVIQFKDIHPYKNHYLLSDYPDNVMYTNDRVNLSKDFQDIIIPSNVKLRCNDNDEIITDSTRIINYQNVYKRKLRVNDLENFVKNKLIMKLYFGDQKILTNQQQYVAVFDNLNEFNYVNRKKVRFVAPLIKYVSFTQDKNLQQHQTNKKLFNKSNQQNSKDLLGHSKLNLSNYGGFDSFEFLLNENNLNACLVIEIELNRPLLPRKKCDLNFESIRSKKLPNIHDQNSQVSLKSLEAIFTNCIAKYVENINSETTVNKVISSDSHHGDGDDYNEKMKLNEIKCKQKIYGSALPLLCSRFDILAALQNNNLHDKLEDCYIYAVNKIHEIYASGELGKTDRDEHEFRLQCAMECTAFNMLDDAKEFYLMNIRDNELSAPIIDYAIHNIFIGDLHKAHECCTLALNNSSDDKYIGFILQSYIAYVNNNKQMAEEFLNHCIGVCKNFLEAWVALYCIHLEVGNKQKMEFIETKLMRITKNTKEKNALYTAHIHKRKEIIWQPMNTNDPYLKGIIKFIQLGCFNYASIGLSVIAIHYGCSSFEYAYHTALIDYYHKDYSLALRSLSLIKHEDIHENYEKQKLQMLCLLEMKSDAFFSNFNKIVFSDYSRKRSKDIQRSLLYLKLGTFYMNEKKFKTSQYYIKKSVCHFGTYMGFLKLGEILLKFREWNNANICYKMAFQINEFNPYSWTYLAVTYFYKNMIPQSKFCALKARQNERIGDKMRAELDKIDKIIEYQEQIACKTIY